MSYKQVLDDIKGNNIERIYVLYGEEGYLMEEAVKKLKQHLVASDFESLNYSLVEGKDLSVGRLIDACETLPFMAERRLVAVKDFEGLQSKKKALSEQDEGLLIDYFSQIPSTTCLILYGLATVDSRKKLLKQASKHGKVLNFEKLKENELVKWILGKLKKRNKKMEQQEVAYFINNMDYLGKNAQQNLYDIENELDKIISYSGEEELVQRKHIEAVSVLRFQNDIFKLMDAIGGKNLSEALKRLNQIIDDGEAAVRLMFTLSNHITNILSAKLLLEEGYTTKLIASKLGLHPYVAGKAVSQSAGFTVERLRKLLNQFLVMDLMVKTGKISDRIAIELLVVEICIKK